MAEKLCDICRKRPAVASVRVKRNGKEQTLDVCEYDLRRLEAQQQMSSPFSSFFNNQEDPFDKMMSFGDFPKFASDLGYPIPRHREAVDISQFFSEQTKELIQQAGEKAAELQRKEVDTEHLLYTLADSDVVQEIFKQFKIKPQDVKQYIDANAPKGAEKLKGDKIELSISPRLKNVFEFAFGVSRELGHSYVGPEHLLIGLSEEEGLAGELLTKYGLTPEALRQQVVKVVGRGAEDGRVESKSSTPQLDKYSRDLSKIAREGKLDPVIGRTDEIETAIEILSRRTKNNPVLIGEPGVGKTAIVEGLAQRIVNEDVPEVLLNKRVVELNTNSMIAGTKYRGEFEERIKNLLEEVTQHKEEIILFVDEVHTIVGAGSSEGGLDVANVIKPYLARGDLHLIGATTLSEYQKHIEKDSALERRFQPIFISEPTIEQTIEILRGLRDKYEAHHKVKITDEAIVAAATLSDRYVANRFLPDKAIDLIDQAASRVRIQTTLTPREIRTRDEKIAKLKREQEAASTRKQFDRAKELDKEIKSVTTERNELEEKQKRQIGITTAEVKTEHIAQILSKLTGIPVTELTEEERNKLLKMEEKLHERVIGQEEAISAVSDAIRRSRAGLSEKNRPIATFLFLGPTGVGKTELAKALAWQVFGDEEAMVRIDMSEYMERHTVSRLIGAPPGYVGYEEAGQLTEAVRRRPYRVILLDEIEKAHPDVYNILLQVFDEGRLTDGKGRSVNFTNTIIIATSNLGSDIIQENLRRTESSKKGYQELKNELMSVLRSSFRPEFLNRIDEIIVFHALSKEQVGLITKLQMERVRLTAKGQGIDLIFSDSLIEHLTEVGYIPEFGARELRRRIQTEVETVLAKAMLKEDLKPGDAAKVSYKTDAGVVIEKVPAKETKEPKERKRANATSQELGKPEGAAAEARHARR